MTGRSGVGSLLNTLEAGGFGVTTSTVNITEPCNSKGEVSSKRQKHEQPSSSSKSSSNHKKRHTSTDENRGSV
uniref:Uncharacterized protein n=1 Tax=Timema douglasi TaxID=61478 RepID=A0A7R8VVT7_TIMDO|nr:unnamed protein product [Timema douglasi]